MNDNQKIDFSEAIKELEEINGWFQEEEINLDEGLTKFRRGLDLIKQCKERLKQVENEFIEINKEYGTKEEPESSEKTEDKNLPF